MLKKNFKQTKKVNRNTLPGGKLDGRRVKKYQYPYMINKSTKNISIINRQSPNRITNFNV